MIGFITEHTLKCGKGQTIAAQEQVVSSQTWLSFSPVHVKPICISTSNISSWRICVFTFQYCPTYAPLADIRVMLHNWSCNASARCVLCCSASVFPDQLSLCPFVAALIDELTCLPRPSSMCFPQRVSYVPLPPSVCVFGGLSLFIFRPLSLLFLSDCVYVCHALCSFHVCVCYCVFSSPCPGHTLCSIEG